MGHEPPAALADSIARGGRRVEDNGIDGGLGYAVVATNSGSPAYASSPLSVLSATSVMVASSRAGRGRSGMPRPGSGASCTGYAPVRQSMWCDGWLGGSASWVPDFPYNGLVPPPAPFLHLFRAPWSQVSRRLPVPSSTSSTPTTARRIWLPTAWVHASGWCVVNPSARLPMAQRCGGLLGGRRLEVGFPT
jgi:hypothetical protein